jgi:hypothetical protein
VTLTINPAQATCCPLYNKLHAPLRHDFSAFEFLELTECLLVFRNVNYSLFERLLEFLSSDCNCSVLAESPFGDIDSTVSLPRNCLIYRVLKRLGKLTQILENALAGLVDGFSKLLEMFYSPVAGWTMVAVRKSFDSVKKTQILLTEESCW